MKCGLRGLSPIARACEGLPVGYIYECSRGARLDTTFKTDGNLGLLA